MIAYRSEGRGVRNEKDEAHTKNSLSLEGEGWGEGELPRTNK